VADPHEGQAADLAPDPGTSPPRTGHAAVDDALHELADLGSAPLADHHDRLAKAHEALHEALDRPDNQGDDNQGDDGKPR
jgi:hypothetical protein